MDTGNGSVIWFGIDSPNAPFVVDQDTGVVTTAGVFRGLSGETIDVQVRAFDNFGVSPTEFTIDTLSVSDRHGCPISWLIFGHVCNEADPAN